MSGGSRLSKGLKIALLALGILGTNAVTAWMLTRGPPPVPTSILPEHKVVAAEPAKRIYADFSGEYESGGEEGDRGLSIGIDGTIRWFVFGPDRTIAGETALNVQAAESNGRPVLVADNHGMIEIKNPVTVIYFGEEYRRKTK